MARSNEPIDQFALHTFVANDGRDLWDPHINNSSGGSGDIVSLAQPIYTHYSPLLVVGGLILLLAMVGPILLTHERRSGETNPELSFSPSSGTVVALPVDLPNKVE